MILIVDDNDFLTNWLSGLIADMGLHVVSVSSGAEALDLSGRSAISLILMDLGLKDESGIDTAIKIRTLPPPFGTVPIVAITGAMDARRLDAWYIADFAAVLVKPFAVAELKQSIDLYARNVENLV